MTAMHLAIRAKNRKRFEILRFVRESTAQVRPAVVKKFHKNNFEFAICAEHPADVLVLAYPLARASMEHFIDLCRMLGEPTPAEADPTGETYCFERGARKDTGGDGWADVWKRGCFAWEYKGRRANLDAAFNQLRQYALALENLPLLIVSDMMQFRIRTNWTNSVSETYEFALDDLADAGNRDKLKWALSDPERLRPGETRQMVTERAVVTFEGLAQSLRERGHDPQTVAHFVNRLVFCMFAEDAGLLMSASDAICRVCTVALNRSTTPPKSSSSRARSQASLRKL